MVAEPIPGPPGPRTLWAHAVASGLGSGRSPIAPGTAGSVVGLVLFWPLAGATPLVQLSAAVALYFVGVVSSAIVARELRREDPGLVVVDEVVGMWFSLVALPLTPATVAVAFLLFRVFDVVKPYPARDLEELPGGWGIMSDDVVAGVYVNAAVRALLVAFPA